MTIFSVIVGNFARAAIYIQSILLEISPFYNVRQLGAFNLSIHLCTFIDNTHCSVKLNFVRIQNFSWDIHNRLLLSMIYN